MGPFVPIALEYTAPAARTPEEVRRGLLTMIPEDQAGQIVPELHAALIDASVQRSAAIAHDQNESLAHITNVRLQRVNEKINSLALMSETVEPIIQRHVTKAITTVMEVLTDISKELRADYQQAVAQAEARLMATFQTKLDNLEDAFVERLERLESEVKNGRKNPSVPNPPAVRTPPAGSTAALPPAQPVSAPPAPAVPMNAIPAKIPPPPKFSGSNGKVSAQEWVEKMGLYFGTLRNYDDHDCITQALFRVTGDAYKFLAPLIRKASNSEPLGTWEDFTKSILMQYGKQTDKEIAKKEIRQYFGPAGKKLAEEQYFHYCERFRTLGRLAETDNGTLVWEFTETLPEKVKDTLNMLSRSPFFKAPTEIEPLIDFALEVYQTAYPDKIKGSIFSSTTTKKEEKKKETETAPAPSGKKPADKKGKKKAAAPRDPAKPLFCNYCKQEGHGVDSCPKLAANRANGTHQNHTQRQQTKQQGAVSQNVGALLFLVVRHLT